MYQDAKTLRAQETYAWKWNLVPVLVVATWAIAAVLMPQAATQAEREATAAAAASVVDVAVSAVIVPSPQPGEGEPELVPAELPQSY